MPERVRSVAAGRRWRPGRSSARDRRRAIRSRARRRPRSRSRAAAGQAAAVGVHQRGAGAGAAGEGQPGAALPDPQADTVRREDLREADVGALGEQRVVLQPGAEFGDGTRRRASATKKVACGLPMRRRPGSPGNGRCSVSIVRERDVAPVEPGRAHVHADPARPRARSAGRSPAMVRMTARPGRSSANSSAATQRVALPQAPASEPSGLRDAHEGVGALCAGLDRDELVAADPGAPIGEAPRLRGRDDGGMRRAQDDEVVAGAVHLAEWGLHRRPYRPPSRCRPPMPGIPG